MVVPGNAKNIGIHIARGLAYITFPVGAFLFGLFILTALQGDLDFTTVESTLLNIAAVLLFFIPPLVILFLHPSSKSLGADALLQANRTLSARIEYYIPHVLIIVALAAIGFVLFVFGALFVGLTSGA